MSIRKVAKFTGKEIIIGDQLVKLPDDSVAPVREIFAGIIAERQTRHPGYVEYLAPNICPHCKRIFDELS